MNKTLHRVIVWAPRVLGILAALFLGLFALDVFDMGLSFWETIGALLIHLVPSLLLLIVVALSWRWPWLGGLLFVVLGALYVWATQPHPWTWDVIVAGPLFLTGLLFLLGWWAMNRQPSAQ